MEGGNICIIGPKGAGKTTYLAALTHHSRYQKRYHKGKEYKVYPQNPDSKKLSEEAEEILLTAKDFEPTNIGETIRTVYDLPFYSFTIELKKNWFSAVEKIQLTCRDYPGEVFENLGQFNQSDTIHSGFIDECFTDVIGCLIMLTGWEPGIDKTYKSIMDKFISVMDKKERSQDLKLAIVMSKCERGEIWPGRLDPELDLFDVHLPKTRQLLRNSVDKKNLRFFALSTFGVTDKTDPRPNREDRITKNDEPGSVLRDPDNWKPYNMIEPLYWLSKTKKKIETK